MFRHFDRNPFQSVPCPSLPNCVAAALYATLLLVSSNVKSAKGLDKRSCVLRCNSRIVITTGIYLRAILFNLAFACNANKPLYSIWSFLHSNISTRESQARKWKTLTNSSQAVIQLVHTQPKNTFPFSACVYSFKGLFASKQAC